MSQESHSGLHIRDLVRVRGGRWRVAGVDRFPDCEALQLTGSDPSNLHNVRTLLYPFDRPSRLTGSSTCRVVTRRRWMRALGALLAAPPHDALWAAADARIRLSAFQLEPALAIIRGRAARVLIADHVGLGKTIEAGLILAELRQRRFAERTLILAPASLSAQWSNELSHRFRIDSTLADSSLIRERVATLPRGINPWHLPGVWISSYDFVKQPEVLQNLHGVPWDVLIVDEAHNVVGRTARHSAVQALAVRSRYLILLTATPHAGDENRFRDLCALGLDAPRASGQASPSDKAQRQRILLFRRSRVDAGLSVARRVWLLPVAPTPEERRVHVLLARYARLVWREATHRGRPEALIAMTVLVKRSFSSAGSLGRSLQRRQRWLFQSPTDDPLQLALMFDNDEDPRSSDEEPSSALKAPGLFDATQEREWLERLIQAASEAARAESKLHRLRRFLAKTGEPVIVFTEYRDTLRALANALAPIPIACLHGALTRQEREHSENCFRTGGVRVLLATDTASEGLNLHARCRLVVNYELPWNPMRLEQRIGRVDRLGQERPVRALNLVARGTAEANVLARLARRLETVRRSVGVVDDVLGSATADSIEHLIVNGRAAVPLPEANAAREPNHNLARLAGSYVPSDTTEEAARELARLTLTRNDNESSLRSDSIDAGLNRRAPWVARIRRPLKSLEFPQRASGSSPVLVVLRAVIEDGAGRHVEAVLIPIVVSVAARYRSRRAREIREGMMRMSNDFQAACVPAAASVARARLHAIQRDRAGWLARRRERETLIGAVMAHHVRQGPVQPALFDSRALRALERATRQSDGWREMRTRAERDLDAAANLVLREPAPLFVMVIA